MRVGAKLPDNRLDRPRCVLCNAQLDPNGLGRKQTALCTPDASTSGRIVPARICLACKRAVYRDTATLERFLAKLDALLA